MWILCVERRNRQRLRWTSAQAQQKEDRRPLHLAIASTLVRSEGRRDGETKGTAHFF